MSELSSEGRPSVSTSSSHTLNSRYSSSHAGNGEGSSTQRLRHATGHDGDAGHSSTASSSRTAGSPLRPVPIEEQDNSHRKQRNRKSGGFLLDPIFPSGPASRTARRSAHAEDATRTRNSRHAHAHSHESNTQRNRIQADGSGVAHSSPLSRQVAIADETTGEEGNVAHATGNDGSERLRVTKTRNNNRDKSSSRQSASSDVQAPAAIDPNQLVHMALDLSESRRRNYSAGQIIGAPGTDTRRVRSSIGPHTEGSLRTQGNKSSLGQYLNEQRRISRAMSPTGGRSSPSRIRHLSTSAPRHLSVSVQGQSQEPSAATLARRDKARAYIELHMEYLRLLDYLPPLKPDASAPGNFVVTANNVPGSPHAFLTRTLSHANAKHDLGRPYNPLQYLRNRRTRARERVVMDHGSEEFSDLDLVRDWVDRVEFEIQTPHYRQHNKVALPDLHEDYHGAGLPSKPSRPRMGWVFTPEELLADAHWAEQGENKTLLEDRHGRKIFPLADLQRPDLQQPRASKEYSDKGRKSWTESVKGVKVTDSQREEESDQTSERGRKRRLLPGLRVDDKKSKKHSWRGSRAQSSSYSDSSSSDSDSLKHRQHKSRRTVDVNNNTGPLELRINEMLEKEKEAKEKKSHTPTFISPDTPDKWGFGKIDPPAHDSSRASLEVPATSNGSTEHAPTTLIQDLKVPPKNRTNYATSSSHPHEPRSSFEDLDSTAPSTPLQPKPFPHIGTNLSPPPSRGGSFKKTSKHKLDLFRSDESTKGHKLDPDSAGTDKQRHGRHSFEETHDDIGLGPAIMAAPAAVKSLLTHRRNESHTSLSSPEGIRKDNRDSREQKEAPSAVTRFLKGVKNEGSKVGEFIFRRDRPPEDSDTSSDSEDDGLASDGNQSNVQKRLRPNLSRNTTAATIASTTSKKNGRYHVELPVFRSTNQSNDQEETNASDYFSDDHISHQARSIANSRSQRFKQLAPPPIDMDSISVTSTPGPSRPSSPDAAESEDRLSKVLARPGGVGQAGQPITSLAYPRTSRPKLENRHWSITDDTGDDIHRSTAHHEVTPGDIARVRALLLCSGVKAREIARRAREHRQEPPRFLKRTAQAVNAELYSVPRQEEHVLAARILVQDLESSTHALQASAQQFKDQTIKDLTSRISDLRSRVEADLFPRVRQSGEEAVRITTVVSGDAPLTVKQIMDEIDKMIRMRRRRMRYMRRVGWMLVEWMLLGFMWCVWLIVVIVGFFKKGLKLSFGIVRWLLWL
ncbi:hypothetical protein BU24DRAFT_417710 [Aaosphaeria arxii CBS 175.79]|uniref:Uncharacterized protein n=1 Tax=Aaosphaeria arxii CBS 175.79 TaxID=1450172 RepID=A0A6A5YBS7_9PLEO|nr:uncharacterized protein BU24DRAFT_417710 [Aaosphaeria arxii CBS 175.79]KAF2022064.1 hypothetical protein BU24DRAFT_417710 [Aaosphaeria arxii CBS 175.79]